ncbi:MAG: hypothetical protein LQ339_008654 [Xanthoria mediterranea]|nr:MAG: hypothetical protein LQ339_008654 [Xanthoria mediterranea]
MATSSTSNIENGNVFEDLSGTGSTTSDNPYDALIDACGNSPVYRHFLVPNGPNLRRLKSKAVIRSTERPGMARKRRSSLANDPASSSIPFFTNWCILKSTPILPMIGTVSFSGLVHHQIDEIVNTMSSRIAEITDYPLNHRARLVKPMLSYDTAAIALSFVPAAGESPPDERQSSADNYTYHHLRRDLYGLSRSIGVEVASRYVVPSAHLTIARFVTPNDISISEKNETPDPLKVQKLLDWIEMINTELRDRYWPKDNQHIKAGGEWIVGQKKGLDCRKGTLWYGGGETVRLGKGF